VNKQTITHRPENRTITDLVNLYEDGLLKLEPGFQRQSVWTERDRAKLIDSILRNYPLPAVFLYRREDDGQIIYDVITGKALTLQEKRRANCCNRSPRLTSIPFPRRGERELTSGRRRWPASLPGRSSDLVHDAHGTASLV